MKHGALQVEVEAESIAAAVEEALAQLDCTRVEADIEVLQEHSAGLLGLFGRRPARVRAVIHDRGSIARQVVRKLLALTDLKADVGGDSSRNKVEINLCAENPSLLIGRQGQTLEALQALTTTITDRLTTDRTPIFIDVDGYCGRRRVFLKKLARHLTRQVRKTGKPATTPPLKLSERRILHELFNQEHDMESRSKAHDGDRKVVIIQPRN